MEKRLPFALLLCLVFVFLYTDLDMKPGGDGADTGTATTPAADTSTGGATAPPATVHRNGGGAAIPVVDPPAANPAHDLPPSDPVAWSGSGFDAIFQTRGGGLSALRLSEYRVTPESDESMQLLGLVDPSRDSFVLRDLADRWGLERAIWAAEQDAEGRLVFTHVTDDGVRFVRRIEPTPDPFVFGLDIEVHNDGGSATGTLNLVLGGPQGLLDDSAVSFVAPPTALAVVREPGGEEFLEWSGGDLLDGTPRRIGGGETLVATGAMTNYFASAIMPEPDTYVTEVSPRAVLDEVKLAAAVADKQPIDARDAETWRRELAADHRENAAVDLLLSHAMPAAGESKAFHFRVFAGPKSRELLGGAGFNFLRPIIESSYGNMAWINKAMLWVLEFFHDVFMNWGVAIILLTLIVRTCLFPLSRIQQSSMMRYSAVMQRLKPQLDEIKAKHKSNPKKLNEAQMQMMKEHGARPPLGGCLLMFLQFPIWISLFQILRSSIELRQAPFFAWIDDLSQPDAMPLGIAGFDTLNLLPILMAGAMVLSMKAQPKPADEAQAQQQKLMAMLMPGLMLVFLYGYPAGLALYILTSSLLGIFEIRVIRKFFPVDGVPTAKPA